MKWPSVPMSALSLLWRMLSMHSGPKLSGVKWGQSSNLQGGTWPSGLGQTVFTGADCRANWRENSGGCQWINPLRGAGSRVQWHSPVHFKVMHTHKNTQILPKLMRHSGYSWICTESTRWLQCEVSVIVSNLIITKLRLHMIEKKTRQLRHIQSHDV